MKVWLVVIVSFCFVSLTNGQSFPVQAGDIQFLMNQSRNYKSDQEIVDGMQALLIEELFIKKMLTSEIQDFLDEDDESGLLGSDKKQRDMQNMIMSRVLSQEMAKQDLLRLRQYLLTGRASGQFQEVQPVTR